MPQNTLSALGIIGNILLVLAYLPQIKKLIVTKKAEDISIWMWIITFFGDLALLVYALMINDSIFTALFTLFMVENIVILYLTAKFSKKNSPPETPTES